MRLFTIFLSAALMVGCSSSGNESLQENTGENSGSVQDRLWLLTSVQDNAGNQIPVFQENDFEFTVRLDSTMAAHGDEVMPDVLSVDGINVCNSYTGGYTLEDGVLTLFSVSESDQDCDREDELTAKIFKAVLFSFDTPSMLSLDNENDRLTIASGSNEALFFNVKQE